MAWRGHHSSHCRKTRSRSLRSWVPDNVVLFTMMLKSVVITDPARSWASDVGIDDPLPAAEILSRVFHHFRSSRVGSVFGSVDRLTSELHAGVARALRMQAEMRMVAQDFDRLDGMARELLVRDLGTGSIEVVVPAGWTDALDRILHTWTCPRCGGVVPGVRHGREDCDAELARGVMED